MEGYLHTVFPSGEVLAFSLVLALAYEYPYTLGQQQPDLQQCLTYSSVYGVPLIAPKEVAGTRLRQRRVAVGTGTASVGYVLDECVSGGTTHRDIVHNRWGPGQAHYECHYDECVIVATTRMYFTTEEEYLVHWSSFHAAIST